MASRKVAQEPPGKAQNGVTMKALGLPALKSESALEDVQDILSDDEKGRSTGGFSTAVEPGISCDRKKNNGEFG